MNDQHIKRFAENAGKYFSIFKQEDPIMKREKFANAIRSKISKGIVELFRDTNEKINKVVKDSKQKNLKESDLSSKECKSQK